MRNLVGLHRGTVVARSEGPGRGSEFRVELPLSRESVLVASAPVVPTVNEPSRRFLVVDDSVDASEALAHPCSRFFGHEVSLCHDEA